MVPEGNGGPVPCVLLVGTKPDDLVSGLYPALRDAGVDLVAATEESEALGLLNARLPAVVVADVDPWASWFTGFCAAVRHHDQVALFILGGSGGRHTAVRALRLGADGYITAPFRMEEVLAWVLGALRQHRQ